MGNSDSGGSFHFHHCVFSDDNEKARSRPFVKKYQCAVAKPFDWQLFNRLESVTKGRVSEPLIGDRALAERVLISVLVPFWDRDFTSIFQTETRASDSESEMKLTKPAGK